MVFNFIEILSYSVKISDILAYMLHPISQHRMKVVFNNEVLDKTEITKYLTRCIGVETWKDILEKTSGTPIEKYISDLRSVQDRFRSFKENLKKTRFHSGLKNVLIFFMNLILLFTKKIRKIFLVSKIP